MNEFKRKHKKDMSGNKRSLRRLRTACERAKRTLSASAQASIEIDSLFDGIDFYTSITRARFEELCSDLFKGTLEPVEKAMRDAKLDKSSISDIVLVGGSTRIPKVQKLLQDFFNGKELNKSINPDEAVAYGATLQAAILNGDTDLDMVLMDVIPMSLGWKSRDGEMVTMLKKNTKIPSQHTSMSASEFVTFTAMGLYVYEGERLLAEENILLGKLQVETRQGEKSQWKIHFEVDTNGILTASIQDQLTRNIAAKEMQRSSTSLSKKDVKRLGEKAKAFKRADEKEIERLTQKNKLLSLCTNIRYFLRTEERLSNLSEKEREKVEKRCQVAVEWTNSNLGAAREEFQGKTKELRTHWAGVLSKVGATAVMSGT